MRRIFLVCIFLTMIVIVGFIVHFKFFGDKDFYTFNKSVISQCFGIEESKVVANFVKDPPNKGFERAFPLENGVSITFIKAASYFEDGTLYINLFLNSDRLISPDLSTYLPVINETLLEEFLNNQQLSQQLKRDKCSENFVYYE